MGTGNNSRVSAQLSPKPEYKPKRKGERMKTRKLAVVENEVNKPNSLHDKINALRSELRERVLERDEVIDGAFIALLAKLNVFLLGKPGTAKSYLSTLLCKAIEAARYFEYLMMKGTKPEELYGPLRLSKLANDQYVYNTTNRLPEAHIGFLDEIWKASSAILNTLLKALNEHTFVNDGINTTIPLQTCFSASNELPEDASLDALYDRFQLRYEVSYIADSDNFKKLVRMRRAGTRASIVNTITLDELQQAQQEVEMMSDEGIDEMLNSLKARFTQAGLEYSDRRWQSAVEVLCASAWLAGRDKVTYEDVAQLVALFWDRPEQKREVKKIVLAFSNPDLQAALTILDEAQSVADQAIKTAEQLRARGEDAYAVGGEANKKMNELKDRLSRLDVSSRQQEIIEQVKKLQNDVQKKCLGI